MGARWPASGLVVVASTMVVGGAAGSTAGGIKLVRAVSLAKGILRSVTDYFREEDDWQVSVAEEEAGATAGHSASEFQQAAAIGVLWIALLVATTVVALRWLPGGAGGQGTADVLFEVASAQGNVGLSTGITGPGMPTPVKAALTVSMWIGRLEIVPVIVTLRVIIKGFE